MEGGGGGTFIHPKKRKKKKKKEVKNLDSIQNEYGSRICVLLAQICIAGSKII